MSTTNSQKILAELASRELARRYYKEYLAYVNRPIWVRSRFSEYLADRVQAFIEADTGNAYDIMVISCPPQHGKTMTITESLPSWYLGRNPRKRVIEVSYNEDSATRFLKANKRKVKDYGSTVFGLKLGGVDRSDRFELASGGSILSRGVMAGITGNPADLLIIDDPIKNRQEADSETTRNAVWAEWRDSMKSRLSAGAKVILIMTPWHEDDIRARILNTEQNVTLIRLPCEAEENDPMGRAPGDPLCPEIGKDAAWLQQFKAAYMNDPEGGQRSWQALYQCNPVIEGGNMVLRSWWQYYDVKEIRTFGTEAISVDATFKDKDDSDFVAIQVWGKLNGNYYLRYRVKEHLNFPSTVAKIQQCRTLFPNATRVYIEDKANGSAIIQVLQKTMIGVIPVNPKGGKVARVNAISPAIETGHVFLPKDAPWLEEYLKEWSEFPNGKHDDEVDATSQAISNMWYAYDVAEQPGETDVERMEREADEYLLSENMYDVYDDSMGWW